MSKYIDLNYEEISPERDIRDGAFANGLQNFRFNVAPAEEEHLFHQCHTF